MNNECGADLECTLLTCKRRHSYTLERECPYPSNPRIKALEEELKQLKGVVVIDSFSVLQPESKAPVEKKKIKDVGKVFPCRKCGSYPHWGAFFIQCPNLCFETDYNDPPGHSVKHWNKHNDPKKTDGQAEAEEAFVGKDFR